MGYREVSEIRDGMRIDWDVPITMEDGIVLRADVYRPVKDGRYPVIMTYGPYGKWLAFQDGYKTAWDRMAESHPDVVTGSTNKYQNWEVVDPEKWVPDGYAVRAGRFARLRALAGLCRPLVAAGGEGLRRLHRMGRRASLEQRQGRPQRHLLLRHEPVAGRLPAAAAPGGDVHLGGRGRFLPRRLPPWRHSLHVPAELVRHAGQVRAARPGQARLSQPHDRRLGLGSRDADAGGTRRQPLRLRQGRSSTIRSTTSSGRRCRPTGRR